MSQAFAVALEFSTGVVNSSKPLNAKTNLITNSCDSHINRNSCEIPHHILYTLVHTKNGGNLIHFVSIKALVYSKR
jgi:hypothetical protein